MAVVVPSKLAPANTCTLRPASAVPLTAWSVLSALTTASAPPTAAMVTVGATVSTATVGIAPLSAPALPAWSAQLPTVKPIVPCAMPAGGVRVAPYTRPLLPPNRANAVKTPLLVCTVGSAAGNSEKVRVMLASPPMFRAASSVASATEGPLVSMTTPDKAADLPDSSAPEDCEALKLYVCPPSKAVLVPKLTPVGASPTLTCTKPALKSAVDKVLTATLCSALPAAWA